MEIHGREVHFLRTVGANCKIADLAPDGSMEKLMEEKLFSDNYRVSQETAAEIIVILNEAYIEASRFEDPDFDEKPLTKQELFLLPDDAFNALFHEAMKNWAEEKPTIETEPINEVGKKTEEKAG